MTFDTVLNFLLALVLACVAGVLAFLLVLPVAFYISSFNADPRYPTMPIGEVFAGIAGGVIAGISSLIILFKKLQRRDKARASKTELAGRP